MIKRHQLQMSPRIKYRGPKCLQDMRVLVRITRDPRRIHKEIYCKTTCQYMAYTKEEAFYRVVELLMVPVEDPKLSAYRAKAVLAIVAYLTRMPLP
jgi:hypothetical protein